MVRIEILANVQRSVMPTRERVYQIGGHDKLLNFYNEGKGLDDTQLPSLRQINPHCGGWYC